MTLPIRLGRGELVPSPSTRALVFGRRPDQSGTHASGYENECARLRRAGATGEVGAENDQALRGLAVIMPKAPSEERQPADKGSGRPRGRPVEKTMPAPIPDTPENIAKAIMKGPPKKKWRYLGNRSSARVS